MIIYVDIVNDTKLIICNNNFWRELHDVVIFHCNVVDGISFFYREHFSVLGGTMLHEIRWMRTMAIS